MNLRQRPSGLFWSVPLFAGIGLGLVLGIWLAGGSALVIIVIVPVALILLGSVWVGSYFGSRLAKSTSASKEDATDEIESQGDEMKSMLPFWWAILIALFVGLGMLGFFLAEAPFFMFVVVAITGLGLAVSGAWVVKSNNRSA